MDYRHIMPGSRFWERSGCAFFLTTDFRNHTWMFHSVFPTGHGKKKEEKEKVYLMLCYYKWGLNCGGGWGASDHIYQDLDLPYDKWKITVGFTYYFFLVIVNIIFPISLNVRILFYNFQTPLKWTIPFLNLDISRTSHLPTPLMSTRKWWMDYIYI